ncbi:MAG: hypothetical protein NTX50_08340 [Candidatus Sumerlaeota bacterium]|nr:hypothetical protein [Candidatus Sumerlaeota bacterium]
MAEREKRYATFGEATYHQGARERLLEAGILLGREHFAGSVYLAGRGVEGMLRAVVWKNDPDIRQGKKALETGHDLRQLSTMVSSMGLLSSAGRDDDFTANIQKVGRLWFNNLRFASNQYIERRWSELRETDRRRTLKKASGEFYEACSAIIKRCEVLLCR